jgi:hypothetical protein
MLVFLSKNIGERLYKSVVLYFKVEHGLVKILYGGF